MKRIFTIITAALCLWGCSDERNTEFWSTASYATIDAITGDYSMISATWSEPIDLSGEGFVTDDILYQLECYGWTGIQSIRYLDETVPTSVLYRSSVLQPESPSGLTQINLYVPYPEGSKNNTERPISKADRCNIAMEVYQFHYKVDSRGYISLFNIDDRQMSGDGGRLTDVEIRFDGAYIYFEADTSLYDWSTETWQDGHMSITYQHN